VNEEGRGLCQLKNDELLLVEGGDFFAQFTTSVILPYNDGKLLIANKNNFFLYQGNSTILWNTNVSSFLKGSRIFTAISLNDSTYILASYTKGIIIMDNHGKIKKIFNKNTGLVSNDIFNLYCDSNGNIWGLTRGGISKIELNGCFNYINESQGISGLNYTSFLYKNSLYLGTSDGLYFQALNKNDQETPEHRNFKMVPSTDGNVRCLQQFGDELFCGHNEGVFIINPQHTYHIAATIGVWCFLQPKGFKNINLAGTYQGLMVLEKENQTWKMRGYVKGFNESSRYLIQDEMEEFWISHGNKGLFKLTLSHSFDSVLKIRSFGTYEGLNSAFNNTVYYYNNEVIVSNNNGFYKYNANTNQFSLWHEFNAALGAFNSIQRFIVSPDSSFWVILNDEKIIHVIHKSKNEFESDIAIRKFNKLLAGSFEHILPLDKNTVIIATLEGFAFFDKEKYSNNILHNQNIFQAFIRKIELTRNSFTTLYAGEKINYSTSTYHIPEIKYNQNSLRFSFSSNCLEDIDLTQFQFYLEGFDNSWSPWFSSFQKEYTNLPPGHYKFFIKAINSYDIISKEDYFEFVIKPPWYKSIYAYLSYLLLVLIILLCMYKYLRYRFKLQKKKMQLNKEREMWHLNKKYHDEQIIKQNEILKLNNEKLLTDIYHLEQQKLLQLKDEQLNEELEKAKQEQTQHELEKHELEIVHKNKELSIMAMQIAHKSESLLKIRDYLIKLTEKNNSQEIKGMTTQLFEYIDYDIQHDNEWKEFQKHFDMVHSSFLTKLKAKYPLVSPTLLKLSAYLRLKMSNKQIARLMNTTFETVLKNRYRLREKLRLNTNDNLDDFIERF
jgi:hypothetical protein